MHIPPFNKTEQGPHERKISDYVIYLIGFFGASTVLADPAVTTLATFNYTNGSLPQCSLLADAAGNLYGTSLSGGSGQYGTIFKIAAGTHAMTTLHSFGNDLNGASPMAGLIATAPGILYGTTDAGGTNFDGTVFKFTLATITLTTVATFNGANGANPRSSLLADTSGNLFGTTFDGTVSSPAEDGVVFKFAASTNTLSTQAFFNNANGSYPDSAVIADKSGNLYGTTGGGGLNNDGTVFKIGAGTRTITTLATPSRALRFSATGVHTHFSMLRGT